MVKGLKKIALVFVMVGIISLGTGVLFEKGIADMQPPTSKPTTTTADMQPPTIATPYGALADMQPPTSKPTTTTV